MCRRAIFLDIATAAIITSTAGTGGLGFHEFLGKLKGQGSLGESMKDPFGYSTRFSAVV